MTLMIATESRLHCQDFPMVHISIDTRCEFDVNDRIPTLKCNKFATRAQIFLQIYFLNLKNLD